MSSTRLPLISRILAAGVALLFLAQVNRYATPQVWALLAITVYGLAPLLFGHPLSYWLKRACTAWEALDRGTYIAAKPMMTAWADSVRQEWRRLAPEVSE